MSLLVIFFFCVALRLGETARYYGDDRRADCAFSEWTDWSRLGDGQREVRTRHISTYPTFDGSPCKGERIQYRELRDGPDTDIPPVDRFISMFLPGHHLDRFGTSETDAGEQSALSRDILVLVDTTTQAALFPYYKMMASSLIGEVCGNIGRRPQDNQIAIIGFNQSDANIVHDFHHGQQREMIQDAVLNIRPSRGENPDLHQALSLASSMVVDTDTGDENIRSTKEVLLISTYKDVCSSEVIHEANGLKESATVYVILVGDNPFVNEEQTSCLQNHIASDQRHFLGLDSSQRLVDFTQKLLLLTAEGTDVCSRNGY